MIVVDKVLEVPSSVIIVIKVFRVVTVVAVLKDVVSTVVVPLELNPATVVIFVVCK